MILIDEYDSIANSFLSAPNGSYDNLVGFGPMRSTFKMIKANQNVIPQVYFTGIYFY